MCWNCDPFSTGEAHREVEAYNRGVGKDWSADVKVLDKHVTNLYKEIERLKKAINRQAKEIAKLKGKNND